MDKIKAIIDELGLKFKFEVAVADKIEELEKRIYALEENRKLKDQAITSLEKRYSEVMYMLKDLLRQHRELERKMDLNC